MKKILVPIDFSDHSAYALEVAASIARKKGSQLVVVHMIGISEAVYTKDELQEIAEAKYYIALAKKRFAQFLDKDFLKGISISIIVQNYKIFSEINTIALEQRVDLIVMGSHGSSGLRGNFVGSNTEKVVRTAEVPVLVIKQPISDFKIRKMVFACDFKPDKVAVYRKVMEFAGEFSAELKPVFVNALGEQFLSSRDIFRITSKFFERTGTKTDVEIYCDHSVEKGILNYGEDIKADLIAIPTHGRKGLSHFFMGSIGEDVANHSQLPVLTIKI